MNTQKPTTANRHEKSHADISIFFCLSLNDYPRKEHVKILFLFYTRNIFLFYIHYIIIELNVYKYLRNIVVLVSSHAHKEISQDKICVPFCFSFFFFLTLLSIPSLHSISSSRQKHANITRHFLTFKFRQIVLLVVSRVS